MAEQLEQEPFIGPKSFERTPEDQARFFARGAEISNLVALTTVCPLLILFAQSGVGKTSLLNAGLIPALEADGFEVWPVARVKEPPKQKTQVIRHDTNGYVTNILSWWSEFAPAGATVTTIPDMLKTRPHAVALSLSSGEQQFVEEKPRVVILDQFEELFTLYPEQWKKRHEVFDQLYWAFHADRLLRIILALREEYLGYLDSYLPALRDKAHVRYRLERLRPSAALEAITAPVGKTHRSFAPGVAESLLEKLRMERIEMAMGETHNILGEFVEPVQLQVVCQELWENLSPKVREITQRHLRAAGDVNQALSKFYEKALNATTEDTHVPERQIRRWLETQLITPAETRGTAYRGRTKTGGLPNAAVDKLENLHLIRAESRAGGRWYELAHDRFIEPILASNRVSRQRQRTLELSARSILIVLLLLLLGVMVLQRLGDALLVSALVAVFPLSYFAFTVFQQPARIERRRQDFDLLGNLWDEKAVRQSQSIRNYLPYLTLVMLAVATGLLFFIPGNSGIFALLNVNRSVVAAMQQGFIGAYLYSIMMVYRRYTTHDLQPSLYLYSAFSILAGLTLNYVIFDALNSVPASEPTSGLGAGLLAVLAFALGFFAISLVRWLNLVASRILSIRRPHSEQLPLDLIEGISTFHEMRLGDIGIDNVENLASADIPFILLNTDFSALQVVDWIDQALLYLYIGPSEIDVFHRAKIRTASDFVTRWKLSLEVADNAAEPKTTESGILVPSSDGLATMLKNTSQVLNPLYQLISHAPNFRLISDYWAKQRQRGKETAA